MLQNFKSSSANFVLMWLLPRLCLLYVAVTAGGGRGQFTTCPYAMYPPERVAPVQCRGPCVSLGLAEMQVTAERLFSSGDHAGAAHKLHGIICEVGSAARAWGVVEKAAVANSLAMVLHGMQVGVEALLSAPRHAASGCAAPLLYTP